MSDESDRDDFYRDLRAAEKPQTAEENVRPEFLSSTDKQKEQEKQTNADSETKKGGVASAVGKGAKAAAGVATVVGAGGVAGLGEMASGMYTGMGGKGKSKLFGKGKISKIAATGFLVVFLIVLVIIMVVVNNPLFKIGNLDFNLQKTAGIQGTIAILEKQAEYVTGEMLGNGEVPSGYASDLVAGGIDVGQVTAKGDFVRTNTYIADIEELNEVAVVGSGYQLNKTEEGELAALYDGKVIRAEDFVAEVESNPRMYADFAHATEIQTRYYYSGAVDTMIKRMGVTRNLYKDYQSTGDAVEDQKRVKEIMTTGLDKAAAISMAGCDEEYCNQTIMIASEDVDEIVNSAKETGGGTKSAAQILNSAISSKEPYMAASAFVAIEEPLQRTRIRGDNDLGNIIMNILSEPTTVEYTDVNTGETVTKSTSILATQNFAAAASQGEFSKNEANNFSRDRMLKVTKAGGGLVGSTAVSSMVDRKLDIATKGGDNSVSEDNYVKGKSSASIGLAEKNSSLFTSVVGANRAVEGGAFLSNSLNRGVLGATASDSATVMGYSKVVNDALAWKAEAERSTRSPFDISSPYTFFGSIVHGVAGTIIQNNIGKSGGTSMTTTIGAMAELAGTSVNEILGNVKAEGGSDYLTTFGDICETVNSEGSAGDLYCSSKDTMYTGLMGKKIDVDDEGYREYVQNNMNRMSTIGVKDAEVCRKWKTENNTAIDDIVDTIASLFTVYDACSGVDEGVARGGKYVLSNNNENVENVKKYSGYALYDGVKSLLSDTKSTAQVIMEEYYAKYPEDNSEAGQLARISGMTKEEAQVAIDYAEYLTMIARYDATDRYAFGDNTVIMGQDISVTRTDKIMEELYCVCAGKMEYSDVRNRTLVV